MKTFLIALSMALLSASSFAATASSEAWQDLRPEDSLNLTQALSLPSTRGGTVEARAADEYTVEDIMGLDMISVVLYTFKAVHCPDVDAASEMDLVLVNGMPADSKSEVGVIYLPNCRMEVYVETKDLSTPSFFQK